ncbi:MAG: ribonuclease III [Atopobiaceae bacterium]|nr:ribonuclease III [Atopobiaceae bacterium]MCH4180642.1 ribonuclease III [Atopobiaceae bacterium]MCH4215088.1 ribonuclease III [Atopobiaceae bacterium]MCH4230320.1 ribonuclease III [Atopobiaceae bacterium]MCH4277266.1 ribonuclease III [Atopobiaceae bacterium]
MSAPTTTDEKIARVERICDHNFASRRLITSALTHPSAAEGEHISACYERLEFLGDSILGAIVATRLFERFPDMDEGKLTRLKISLVSGGMLSEVAGELGIGECIVFGESELGTGARGLHSALENVYESVVGALYLDGGYEVTDAFVTRTLGPHISADVASHALNAKSRLQEITQRDLRCAPVYKLVGEEGPAHAPTFTSVVLLDGCRMGRGVGSSKKEAESLAAQDAIERLDAESGVAHGSRLAEAAGDPSRGEA